MQEQAKVRSPSHSSMKVIQHTIGMFWNGIALPHTDDSSIGGGIGVGAALHVDLVAVVIVFTALAAAGVPGTGQHLLVCSFFSNDAVASLITEIF